MPAITKNTPFYNSKLVQLLQTLSKKEVVELKDWLESPWCKNNKHFLPFYEALQPTAATFPAATLQKEAIFAQLYAGKPYNNYLFNNLIRAFTKEVQNYMAFIAFRKSPQAIQQFTTRHLKEREGGKWYESFAKDAIEKIEEKPVKTIEEYWQLHRLYQDIYFQTSGHHRYQGDAPHLVAANRYLDTLYVLEKYKYGYVSEMRTKILKVKEDSLLKIDFSALKKLQGQLKIDAVQLYEFRLKHLTKLTWKKYLQFKQLFEAIFTLSLIHI